MEAITAAVWGPLSFICAYLILTDSSWRWSLQIIISLGQLYGDVLYYATCTFEYIVHGRDFSRPERYYFWGYYVFLNFFWIVVPFLLLVRSAKVTNRALDNLRREDTVLAKKHSRTYTKEAPKSLRLDK